jgi:hypothetical protein
VVSNFKWYRGSDRYCAVVPKLPKTLIIMVVHDVSLTLNVVDLHRIEYFTYKHIHHTHGNTCIYCLVTSISMVSLSLSRSVIIIGQCC